MATLLWLQTGACSGDTMSLLNADSPSVESLVKNGSLDILWHPSLSAKPAGALGELIAAIEAGCDGCATSISATVDFVAAQAEYTPPVIYSRGSREKLVFRVEAVPSPEQATMLRPGLPVDVRLAAQ